MKWWFFLLAIAGCNSSRSSAKLCDVVVPISMGIVAFGYDVQQSYKIFLTKEKNAKEKSSFGWFYGNRLFKGKQKLSMVGLSIIIGSVLYNSCKKESDVIKSSGKDTDIANGLVDSELREDDLSLKRAIIGTEVPEVVVKSEALEEVFRDHRELSEDLPFKVSPTLGTVQVQDLEQKGAVCGVIACYTILQMMHRDSVLEGKIPCIEQNDFFYFAQAYTDDQECGMYNNEAFLEWSAESGYQRPFKDMDDRSAREWLQKSAPVDYKRIHVIGYEKGMSGDFLTELGKQECNVEALIEGGMHPYTLDYASFIEDWYNLFYRQQPMYCIISEGAHFNAVKFYLQKQGDKEYRLYAEIHDEQKVFDGNLCCMDAVNAIFSIFYKAYQSDQLKLWHDIH